MTGLNNGESRFRWEELPNNMAECSLNRAKLPGGWLILAIYSRPESVPVQFRNENNDELPIEYIDSPPSVTLTFFPDPNHNWDGTTLE
jgi:hypothetical protein